MPATSDASNVGRSGEPRYAERSSVAATTIPDPAEEHPKAGAEIGCSL
jgi:hypothetical protein